MRLLSLRGKAKYNFKYDINAILSESHLCKDLEPASKRSSYKTVSGFLEKPSYGLISIRSPVIRPSAASSFPVWYLSP